MSIEQKTNMSEPLNLSNQPLVLEYSTRITSPPSVEPLNDGRAVLRIDAEGSSTGDIEGTITSHITEVMPEPDPVFQNISVMFTLTTDAGSLQGFYTGTIHHQKGATTADIHTSGQILTVSGAYADLYLAQILVTGQVQFTEGRGIGENGTMTILAPR